MKKTEEDIALGKLLKQECHQPEENEWFTPRVVNRLPMKEHRSRRRVWSVISLVALVLCVGCWLWLIAGKDHMVVTVRDITHYVIMGAVTVLALWQVITEAVKME